MARMNAPQRKVEYLTARDLSKERKVVSFHILKRRMAPRLIRCVSRTRAHLLKGFPAGTNNVLDKVNNENKVKNRPIVGIFFFIFFAS